MSSLPLTEPAPDQVTGAKQRRVARKVRALMEELGLDLGDPHLAGTDTRVARAYGELFAGLAPDAAPTLRTFPNTERYAGPLSLTGIPFFSLCAHHLLPFFGSVHIAYHPGDRIVGLSKLARVVEYFARRPQVQERLTEHIVEFLDRELAPAGVMAVVQARHFCIEMRGINRTGLVTTTSAVRGHFAEEPRRREFLALLQERDA